MSVNRWLRFLERLQPVPTIALRFVPRVAHAWTREGTNVHTLCWLKLTVQSLGLDVSAPMFESALRFIKSIESHFLGWLVFARYIYSFETFI